MNPFELEEALTAYAMSHTMSTEKSRAFGMVIQTMRDEGDFIIAQIGRKTDHSTVLVANK